MPVLGTVNMKRKILISGVKIVFLALIFLLHGQIKSFGATVTTGGSGQWGSTTPNAPWPGGIIPASTDNIVIANGHVLTVDGNRTCNSISTTSSNSNSNITERLIVDAPNSLTVTTFLTVIGSKGNCTFTISGTGTVNCSSLIINDTSTATGSPNNSVKLTATISSLTVSGDVILNGTGNFGKLNNPILDLQSGRLTVLGTITTTSVEGGANTFLVENNQGAATGTLILSNPIPWRLTGTGTNTTALNGTGATVIYNGAEAQPILATTYTDLALSGGSSKSITSGTSVSGNLSISGATANIGNGLDITVGTLTLDGLNKISGTWGSTSTTATNTDNIYFNSTSGYVTVGTDTRLTPNFSGLTASQSVCLGTSTITLSGTVSAAGPVYALNGKTVGVTINGAVQNATIAGGAGGFSINFASSAIPASGTPYTITYTYAGDVNLKAAANNTTTALTVNSVIANNTVSSSQTICTGTTPSGLTGTLPTGANGTYEYLWESSTTSAINGFAAASGTSNTRNYTPGSLTRTTWYRRTVTSGGCSNTTSAIQITIAPAVTINAFSPSTSTRCQGSATVTTTTTANNSTGITYSLDAGTAAFPGNSIVTATGAVTYSAGWSGTTIITASADGCNGPATTTLTVNITPTVGTPVFTSGSTSTRCKGAGTFNYTATAINNTGINYTLDAASLSGGNIIESVTGVVTYDADWSGTSIITVTASGCSGPTTATHTATSTGDQSWTGAESTDWNTIGNWFCPYLPDLTTNVQIPNVPRKPILSTGNPGMAKNILINSGSSLTVDGNTLQITGTINNSGTFIATAGTIEMKGPAAQTIGANIFAGNTIQNLTVNKSNSAEVTLQGALKVSGIVKATQGNLSSGGYLTLLSTSAQTALIDGSGLGEVLGNVNMQRYLSSAFGYKYFSSPFTSLTVDAFTAYIDLGATFPSFYRYDENNHRDSANVVAYQSGWIKYLSGTLSPMSGYAANFGALLSAKNISISGIVSNGPISVSLYNHNRKYTKGFNLVGNPYPSPIDWNASSGWTKTNIDNAIYFFDPGSTDQYTGVYSSYVNGLSNGNGNNIIASMQGFFVHVTDPVSPASYPVTGTFGMTNLVRINNLTPLFRDALIDNRTILRFAANFKNTNPIEDEAVLYFDNQSSRSFDKALDALKMTNTDLLVPNIYTLSQDARQLSINGIPVPSDSITRIPLGITILSDGWINFNAKDISQLPSSFYIYLADLEKGIMQDLKQTPQYPFYLKSGVYDQRFQLVFSATTLQKSAETVGKLFSVSRSASQVIVHLNLPSNTKGSLFVTNMSGQVILRREVFEQETVEINPGSSSGVYIITVISGNNKTSEKILIRKDYE